jgi:hypothetical protein
MANIEKSPKQKLVSATEALKNAVGAGIDTKLAELEVVLKSITPNEKKELSTEIDEVHSYINSNELIRSKDKAKDVLLLLTSIRLELEKLKSEVGSKPEVEEEEDDSNVPKWMKKSAVGFKAGTKRAVDFISDKGGKTIAGIKYFWNEIIAGPVADLMKKLGIGDLPPVGLSIKQGFVFFVGMFAPTVAAKMKKGLDAELAFHEVEVEAKALAKAKNEARIKKDPTASPITVSFEGQFSEFKLLTEAERKEIPRRVMKAIKKGETEITLDTLFDGSESEKKDSGEESEEGEKPEVVTEKGALPTTPISFDAFKGEVEVAGHKITVHPSPAAIEVDGKMWKMTGVSDERKGLNFTINEARWTGEEFIFKVRGTFPFGLGNMIKNGAALLLGMNNSEQRMSRGETKTFIEKLATGRGNYEIKDKEKAPTGVDLIQS